MKKHLLLGLLSLCVYPACASHIIGSYLSLASTSAPNEYQIELVVFVDATELLPSGEGVLRNTPMSVRLFGKAQHRLLLDNRLSYYKSEALTYDNPACASRYRLSVRKFYYRARVSLPSATYSSPEGYYLAWEYCCRSSTLTNIRNPDRAGLVAYLEFPPLSGRGYASPVIDFTQGSYLCLNTPYSLRFPASDPRYQLGFESDTPLNGHNDGFNYDRPAQPAPYPPVSWEPGFSAGQPIGGNPGFSIHPTSGLLTVTPSRLGTYVFSLAVTQHEGGKVVGRVYFNFQYPVIDCPPDAPPVPETYREGKPVRQVALCEKGVGLLETDDAEEWNHVWQLDGLTMGRQAQQAIHQPGLYVVKRSFKSKCGQTVTSDTVRVTVIDSDYKPTIEASRNRLCPGDSAVLRVRDLEGLDFNWSLLRGGEVGKGPTVVVARSGTYVVEATDVQSGCPLPASRDTLELENTPPVELRSVSPVQATVCAGARFTFAVEEVPGTAYQWYRNDTLLAGGQRSFQEAMLAGRYMVTGRDSAGCSAEGPSFNLAHYPTPAIAFDSLAPVCAGSLDFLPLSARPAGGVFSGPAIRGDTLDLRRVAPGTYPIVYRWVDANGCTAEARRELAVSPGLTLTTTPDRQIPAGSEVTLSVRASVDPVAVRWYPDGDLSASDSPTTVARPVATTVYYVEATSEAGCRATDSIRVEVVTQLHIPSAFTPNQDGLNDTWEIINLAAFPASELFIYDRWGELVFYNRGGSSAWDGTFRNAYVTAGWYTYAIRNTYDASFVHRGRVLVIR